MTLAQRTPDSSPFAVLYAPRAQADTATAPAKRGPKKHSKAEKEAKILRVNPERADCASWAGMSTKTAI